MKLFIIFVILNVANVIIQTVKSIATIKCGKVAAALVNAVAYGLYTVVVVYTVCELPLWVKVLVVAVANLIGVYVVKLCEEKSRKDKLWKIEATVYSPFAESLHTKLDKNGISHNFINIGKYTIFNIYSESQNQSMTAKLMLDKHKAKYFVSETKALQATKVFWYSVQTHSV